MQKFLFNLMYFSIAQLDLDLSVKCIVSYSCGLCEKAFGGFCQFPPTESIRNW